MVMVITKNWRVLIGRSKLQKLYCNHKLKSFEKREPEMPGCGMWHWHEAQWVSKHRRIECLLKWTSKFYPDGVPSRKRRRGRGKSQRGVNSGIYFITIPNSVLQTVVRAHPRSKSRWNMKRKQANLWTCPFLSVCIKISVQSVAHS